MKRGAETASLRAPQEVYVRRKGGLSRRAQQLFTLTPVARAQRVGLERIENTKRLLRVAADVQAIDRDVLDHVVGVDDEGRSESDSLLLGEDSESLGELLLVVGDPRKV